MLPAIAWSYGRWDQPWPLTISPVGAQKMDFRRSGPLDERRRRVLMDEIASPNEADTTEQATGGAAKGPVRAYSSAVLDERQPRVTELLPVRPLWAVCLILLGLTGIAAIEAFHIHAVTLSLGSPPLGSPPLGSLPLKEGAAQLAALDDPDAAATSKQFDELQREVIRFAIASTRNVQIPDSIFDALKQRMSTTEVVELVAVTAAYNMVARLLVALQLTPETETLSSPR